jgi:polyhydroxybutyrate depolymerase
MKKHLLSNFTFLFLVFSSLVVRAQPSLTSDSILIDGNYRSFHFNKPQSPRNNGSLVFVLHGSGGSGKQIPGAALQLEEKAAAENLLLVYPDGYKRFWNECRKAADHRANVENIDEVTFFDAMIAYFKNNFQIDEHHVFAVGTSGGGHMAYKLAITLPTKFSAVTAIVANLPDEPNMDCPDAKVPVSVMIINGTDDPINPYGGGLMRNAGFHAGTVRSTEKTFQYWASLAGYKGDPVKAIMPDTDPADGRIIERYTYKKKNKPEVVLLKVVGGKHDYPNDINVYLEAWEFFKRQMKL